MKHTLTGKRGLPFAAVVGALLATLSMFAAFAAEESDAVEDDVFVPTEDISEDIAIAFPVDI